MSENAPPPLQKTLILRPLIRHMQHATQSLLTDFISSPCCQKKKKKKRKKILKRERKKKNETIAGLCYE